MSNKVARKIALTVPTGSRPTERIDSASLYAADGGRKYLNRVERERALAAADSLDLDEALFILALAWTGARPSELLSLTPASFQIEAGLIAFKTLKRRRHHVREVPIPEALMAALDSHFCLGDAQRDPTHSGRRLWPWCRQTAWRVTKQVMQLAGITGRPACPRGFRHGFGVGTVQSGVPLNLVQRWLGVVSKKVVHPLPG